MAYNSDRPTCWWCIISGRDAPDIFVSPADVVFEPICGHETCPTATFHGLCLMEFRDDERTKRYRVWNEEMIARLRRGWDGDE